MQSPSESEFRWALSYARPYARRLAVLSALSTVEIGLRILSPWPLKAIVDVVFGGAAPPGWLMPLAAALPGAAMTWPVRLLVTIVLVGVLIQLAHQVVIMLHGRLQVTTSQRMVRFLRERLFSHLQWLTFSQHARTPTGDAVHRLEADARCVDQIVFRGFFPLIFSCATFRQFVRDLPPAAAEVAVS